MYKNWCIALLFIFGLTLAGQDTYACSMHEKAPMHQTTHSTHHKSNCESTAQKDCCTDDQHSNHSDSTGNHCDHSCHQSCHFPTISLSNDLFRFKTSNFLQWKSSDFHYVGLNNSIDYHVIWQPPKIG